jgi:hypothetical protein
VRRRRSHRVAALPFALGVALVVGAWPTLAALSTVAGLFEAGRYDEARAALDAGNQGSRPGEDALWRSRLATDPGVAVGLLAAALADGGGDAPVRIRLALEAAEIEAGRRDHQAALRHLAPLLGEDPATIPGPVHLRAGLSLRALGQLQQAREMLASVRPGDPAFVLARFFLGDIALEQNDPALARRYFAAARKAAGGEERDRLVAGEWRALMAEGEDGEAEDIYAELADRDPGSLALLEIRRLRQVAKEEQAARRAIAAADSVIARPVDRTGRYALQLGAFSDRALALEFQRRYLSQLPDLRIDKTRDERGQFLYKVRTGSFVNPARARTEAEQLARRLGIDVIVADLADTITPHGN